MNPYTLLALLQTEAANSQFATQNHGWSPLLWFWVIFVALLLIGFFAFAFRQRDLPREPPPPPSETDLHRGDREVYP